jgi:hypothetical protein
MYVLAAREDFDTFGRQVPRYAVGEVAHHVDQS